MGERGIYSFRTPKNDKTKKETKSELKRIFKRDSFELYDPILPKNSLLPSCMSPSFFFCNRIHARPNRHKMRNTDEIITSAMSNPLGVLSELDPSLI